METKTMCEKCSSMFEENGETLCDDCLCKLADVEHEKAAESTAFGYHATVNLKVHLSHQVCPVEDGETAESIDSKMVAQAVATAVEALTGPAARELPHLRLYLHGCMVTADIDEVRWLEQVPEPVRPKRCQSPDCDNGINWLVTNKFTPYCSAVCQETGETQ